MAEQSTIARSVLEEAGTTLASEAGIRMGDKPAALWQMLVLVNLLSAPISARIAMDAARELNTAGGTTPRGMAELTWQDRVDALGRGHYVRYDESTATRLGECAEQVQQDHRGDLRRLAADHERSELLSGLKGFSGVGPTGASIFCREAQAVWPWLRPFTDELTRKGAGRVGLPRDEAELGRLVPGDSMAAFASGLTHVARDGDLADRVLERAG